MSVYDHPTKPGWQMIKISHGRKGKPDYIPYPGTRAAIIVDALEYCQDDQNFKKKGKPGEETTEE